MESVTRPAGGYMLCASPRSGSTLLCDLLTRSGTAGAPESYFRPASVAALARTWGLLFGGDGWDRSYIQAVRQHGDAGTGRFGMRIMWSDMPALLGRLECLHPEAHTDVDRLRSVLGVDHFVHLSRIDHVAQAVSLVLATQTGLWHRSADGSELERTTTPKQPHYDHDQIATELRMIETEATGWRTWFESTGIAPLTLTYEELAADPASGMARVLRYLGIVDVAAPAPGTARLATGLNEEWTVRFRVECESAP